MRAGPRIALALVVVASTIAAADPRPADEAFARGRTLMKQKKFEEACAAFAESYRLDPARGTLFNLADCEVSLGKLATALAHYRELALTDSNADRRAMSSKLADQLAPRVPRLVVTLPDPAAGATVTIDGKAATGAETLVDLGGHIVEVTAPGYAPWRETVTAREGAMAEVVVHLEVGPPGPPAMVPAPAPPAGEDDWRRRHRYGTIAVLAGGALVAGGLAAGGLAYAKWQDATSCTGCDRASESRAALVRGDIATGLVAAGLVVASVGVYLWTTASTTAAVSASVGAGGAGLAVTGTF